MITPLSSSAFVRGSVGSKRQRSDSATVNTLLFRFLQNARLVSIRPPLYRKYLSIPNRTANWWFVMLSATWYASSTNPPMCFSSTPAVFLVPSTFMRNAFSSSFIGRPPATIFATIFFTSVRGSLLRKSLSR